MVNCADMLNRLKKVLNNDSQFNLYRNYLYNVRVKSIYKLTVNLETLSEGFIDPPIFDLYAILVTGFLDKFSGIKEDCMKDIRMSIETQIIQNKYHDNGITFIDSELQNLRF
tara:strand:+ start:869 stop:1204 length:336 start_codon:yes stop_codon:yes gene_type:complete